jgi:transcription termination factor NusB
MSTHHQKPPAELHVESSVLHVSRRLRADGSRGFVVKRPDPRVIAALVIEQTLTTQVSAATLLPVIFRRFRQVNEQHCSFATELVYTTLRMRRNVEAHLFAHTTRDLPNDSSLLSHLLVAVAEILYMRRIQTSGATAIDVAVSQVEALRGPRMAGIVNGILSRVLAGQMPNDGNIPAS